MKRFEESEVLASWQNLTTFNSSSTYIIDSFQVIPKTLAMANLRAPINTLRQLEKLLSIWQDSSKGLWLQNKNTMAVLQRYARPKTQTRRIPQSIYQMIWASLVTCAQQIFPNSIAVSRDTVKILCLSKDLTHLHEETGNLVLDQGEIKGWHAWRQSYSPSSLSPSITLEDEGTCQNYTQASSLKIGQSLPQVSIPGLLQTRESEV